MSDLKRTPSAKGTKKKSSRPRTTPAQPAAAPMAGEIEAVELEPAAIVTPPPPEAKSEPKRAVVSSTVEPSTDAKGRGNDVPPPRPQSGPARETSTQPQRPTKVSDDYTLVANYDRNARQFIGSCLEIPILRASAATRELALKDLETRLESHLQDLKRRNAALPEAIYSRRYPERLELRISQGLYRRLDVLSRHEKVALDQLLVELLTSAVERRFEGSSRQASQHQQQHQHQNDRRPDRDRQHNSHPNSQGGGQRQHQGQGQGQGQNRRNQGGNLRGRSYHDTMDNRENFLEYVRNLEKSGGAAGRWKK